MRGSSVEVSGRETDGGSGVPIERRRGRYPIGRGSMQVNGEGCGSRRSWGLAGRTQVERARGGSVVGTESIPRGGPRRRPGNVQLSPKSTECG